MKTKINPCLNLYRGKIFPPPPGKKCLPGKNYLPLLIRFYPKLYPNPLNILKITYGTAIAYVSSANGDQFMDMLSNAIFNKTRRPVMGRAMDAAMMRAKVTANNIANVNTPGYQRVDVSFEKELSRALDKTRLQGTRTNGAHMNIGRLDLRDVGPKAHKPYDPTLPSGVNNVDIDIEMGKLAEAQIAFQYMNKFNQGVFKRLNAAIKGQSTQG